MKDFLKYTFATLTGIVLAGVVLFIIGISSMVAMLSMGDAETIVSKDAVFMLELSGTLSERSVDAPLSSLMGNKSESYGLNDIVASIRKAKENDKIKGIHINANALSAPYASLQEIRRALVDFKTSGKFIYVYADSYEQSLYYLTSLADRMMMNPFGAVDLRGTATEVMFLKGLMDKVGVEADVFRVGTFKSAVEPFIGDKMSEPNREQYATLGKEVWQEIVQAISDSRQLPIDTLNALADAGISFKQAEACVKAKLVDTLIYRSDVRDYLKQKMGLGKDDKLSTLSLKDMKNLKREVPKDKSGNIIAVYYASGQIVDADTSPPLSSSELIIGNDVVKDLQKLQEDDDVKAVVFRVNSPGGSAFASEQIWYAVEQLKAKKPVIVSMGDYAASGGYYISAGADYILAESTTLTGSIGVFGLLYNGSKLFGKLGLTFDGVKTNKYSDTGANLMNMHIRGFSEDEKALIQSSVNQIYEQFVGRCAEGRKMTKDAVKAVAEGRVWTGLHAKDLGLVDELGGIDRALQIAAERAKVDTYTRVEYPKQKSFFENLLQNGIGASVKANIQKQELGDMYPIFQQLRSMQQADPIQASLPYMIRIY